MPRRGSALEWVRKRVDAEMDGYRRLQLLRDMVAEVPVELQMAVIHLWLREGRPEMQEEFVWVGGGYGSA